MPEKRHTDRASLDEVVMLRQQVALLETKIAEQEQYCEPGAVQKAFFDALLVNSPLAVAVVDSAMRVRMCNPAFESLFQYTESECIGQNLDELIVPPALLEEAKQLTLASIERGQITWKETARRRRDGSLVEVEVHGMPWLAAREGHAGGCAFYLDLTRRRDTEQALLRRSRQLETLTRASQHLNEILEISSVMRTLVISAMELVDAASGACGLWQGGRMLFSEYCEDGVTFSAAGEGASSEKLPAWVSDAALEYPAAATTASLENPSEQTQSLPSISVNVPILDRRGELLGCFVIHRGRDGHRFDAGDVAMLKGLAASAAVALDNARMIESLRNAQQALKESEGRIRSIVETAGSVILGLDRDGRIFEFNQEAERVYGYKREDVIGANYFERFLPGEIREAVLADMQKVLGGEPTRGFENLILAKDGRESVIRWNITRLLDQERSPVGIIAIGQDVTETMQAEEVNRIVLRSALDGFWIMDRAGDLLEVNDAYCRLTGYSRQDLATLGLRGVEAVESPDETAAHIRRVVETGSDRFETRHRCKDGHIVDVEVTVNYSSIAGGRFFAFFSDITERRRAELEREVIFEIIRGVSETANLDELLKLIHQSLKRRLSAENCFVALHDPETGLFDFPFFVDQHDEPPPPQRLHRTGTAYVFRQNRPFLFTHERYQQLADSGEIDLVGTMMASWLGVPLRSPSATIGVLVIQDYENIGAYTERDLEFLTAAAGQIAIAIERKRGEEALRRSEQQYRLLFEDNPLPVWVFDYETESFLEVNEAAIKHYGYSREEFLSMTMRDMRAHGDREASDSPYAAMPAMPEQSRAERHKRNDGSEIDVELTVRSITFAGRQCGLVLCDDVTERKAAEQALRESEAKFRTLAETVPVGITIYQDRTVRYANPAAEQIFDCTREELLQRDTIESLHPDFKSLVLERRLARQRGEDVPSRYEVKMFGKDGAERWVEVNAGSIAYEGQPAVLSTTFDITERKQAEEAVRASEERFRELFENANDVLFTLDLGGKFTTLNRAGEQVFGYSRTEAAQLRLSDLAAPEYKDLANRLNQPATGAEEPQTVEMELLAKDGQNVLLEISSQPILHHGAAIGVQGIARDVTQRRQLEERFRQAQKMEAVGRLAGGVAHDFNNLLTAITGYCELILTTVKAGEPLARDIAEIKKAGDRAAALTRQLLAFSRRQVLQPKVLDLNEVIANLEKMLERLIGEDIDLVTILHPGLGLVRADPGQLEQVIMNLSVNARDAMPEGGKLTIETANVELDEQYSRRHSEVQSGSYVMLAVTDSGEGMDEETRSHLFEPFFTTKGVGKGTGLGLSTVYGIVKQSGGHVWAYGEPGKGSSFKMYLPRVEQPAEIAESESAAPAIRRGSETILIVEDADMVRALAKKVLQMNGYAVLEASNGPEAIELSRTVTGTIHLMVSDVVMPQMSGRELAEKLTLIRPEMKVLFISGYPGNLIAHHGVLDPKTDFLQKPFTPSALARKVREILDQ